MKKWKTVRKPESTLLFAPIQHRKRSQKRKMRYEQAPSLRRSKNELLLTEPKASEPKKRCRLRSILKKASKNALSGKREDPEAVPDRGEAPEGDSQPEAELAGDEPEASNPLPEDEEGTGRCFYGLRQKTACWAQFLRIFAEHHRRSCAGGIAIREGRIRDC